LCEKESNLCYKEISMKKKKQKSSHGKTKAKTSKKKVTAIAAPPEFYRVEMEVVSRAADNSIQYTYSAITQELGMSETEAQEKADEMKAMGIGGRIVHLDGTPDGHATVTWGGVERTAAAEKIEQGALDKRA
jgi:hypothetical protein